jgi:hypothetical protein
MRLRTRTQSQTSAVQGLVRAQHGRLKVLREPLICTICIKIEAVILYEAECVRALKGLALARASHSSEIALAGPRCQAFKHLRQHQPFLRVLLS